MGATLCVPVQSPDGLVAALREQQVLDVLERRTVAGSGVWVRVRTSDGVEYWVASIGGLTAGGCPRKH